MSLEYCVGVSSLPCLRRSWDFQNKLLQEQGNNAAEQIKNIHNTG